MNTSIAPLKLEISSDIDLKVSIQQFEMLARINRDLKLERTAEGILIVNHPTGGESGRRNLNLSGQLYVWYEINSELGEAFDSSTGFILPNGAIRAPDASWVSRQRWEALTPEQKRGFLPLVPDFAIELRSNSDTISSLRQKTREYIDNGAKLCWLIDPFNKTVEIYRSNGEIEVLESPLSLDGEDVLPGFSLDLTRIWL